MYRSTTQSKLSSLAPYKRCIKFVETRVCADQRLLAETLNEMALAPDQNNRSRLQPALDVKCFGMVYGDLGIRKLFSTLFAWIRALTALPTRSWN